MAKQHPTPKPTPLPRPHTPTHPHNQDQTRGKRRENQRSKQGQLISVLDETLYQSTNRNNPLACAMHQNHASSLTCCKTLWTFGFAP